MEEEEENDRVWGIERRTTSPAGFGYPAGRWNGRIVRARSDIEFGPM